ncbi:response regulator [candidate division KSB1 bacterium]|nr:response regulator [candidate division KSB1 bacterium]
MGRKLVFISMFVLLHASCVFAGELEFLRSNTDQGLSCSNVTDITQDQYGFIWIGTDNGLNMYDGYQYKIYKKIPGDSTSLIHNMITALFMDSQHRLWIGTIWGISQYNSRLDNFINYSIRGNSGIIKQVSSIFEDSLNNIWVVFGDGEIHKIENTGKEFVLCYSLKNNVTKATIDNDDNFWIGSQNGLYFYDRETDKLTSYHCQPQNENSLSNNYILSLFHEKDQLWIGTADKGISIYNKNTHKFTRIFPEKTNIYFITRASTGQIWFGTSLSLMRFNDKSNNAWEYLHSQDDNKSLSAEGVSCFFEDSQKNIWVGVKYGGICIVTHKKPFHHLNKNTDPKLTKSNISAICEDRHGNLWIGSYNNGIDVINRATRQKKHYEPDNNNPFSLGDGTVHVIFKDSQHRMWLGTYEGGLQLFDEKTGKIISYRHDPDDRNSISSNDVRSIAEDSHHNLWIATNGGGLNKFNPNNQTFTCFRQNVNDNYHSLANDWNFKVLVDAEDNVWVGTADGVTFLTPSLEITNFRNNPNDRFSLSDNLIITIFQDTKHRIWIGTGEGLNLFNSETKNFKRYLCEDGFQSDRICGILEDERGELWLSTNSGIIRFNPESGIIRNFDSRDGMQSNEFFATACLQSHDGELLWGEVDGITYFYPDSIRDNLFTPPVYLTNFKIFNKSIPIGGQTDQSILHTNINQTKEIKLNHFQNVISFEFVALNYIITEKNQYAYIMEGFEKSWNYVNEKREATYTNLDPGKYVFRVKASNNDGIWNIEGASVKIIITPPYWASWWFRLMIIFVLSLIIIGVYNLRTYNIRQVNKQLGKKVDERTRELANEKNLLRTLIDLIPDYIFIKDRQSQFVLNNKSHLHLLGAKKQEDVLGKTDVEIFSNEYGEKYYQDEQKMLATGNSQIDKEEIVIDQTDGSKFWVTSTKILYYNDDGDVQGIVGISHNITQRKKFEEQLKQAKEFAEAANRAKSEFLANMSHEIRTPMNGIIGMTELVLDTKLSKQQSDYLTIAKESAESLSNLLKDILDFSKIEAGKLELEEVDFDLRQVVDSTITSLTIQAQSKRVDIFHHIEPDVPLNLQGDPGRLRQIIFNLLANAIKFTENGEIAVHVACDETDTQTNEDYMQLHFSISDTGIGIPENKLKTIFESFRQADNSTTRKYGGTGLGLAICRNLTELMHGRIWAESDYGKGSTFHFIARFKIEHQKPHETNSLQIMDFNGMRVMIVDDNKTNPIILQQMLDSWKCSVQVYANERDAFRAMCTAADENRPFSLIISDFQSPHLDIRSFVEKVRADQQFDQVKIILISSILDQRESTWQQCVKIDNYLPKPIRRDDLLRILLETMENQVDSRNDNEGQIVEKERPGEIRILLVEDNIINQKVAINLLQKWGYNVAIANNGQQAIEYLQQEAFNLVLMDVQMPVMDGMMATRIIRELPASNSNARIPIIAMTAHAMKGDRERFLEAGMNDYISKPINVNEVKSTVQKYAKMVVESYG